MIVLSPQHRAKILADSDSPFIIIFFVFSLFSNFILRKIFNQQYKYLLLAHKNQFMICFY